jgi:hypothetical protein
MIYIQAQLIRLIKFWRFTRRSNFVRKPSPRRVIKSRLPGYLRNRKGALKNIEKIPDYVLKDISIGQRNFRRSVIKDFSFIGKLAGGMK